MNEIEESIRKWTESSGIPLSVPLEMVIAGEQSVAEHEQPRSGSQSEISDEQRHDGQTSIWRKKGRYPDLTELFARQAVMEVLDDEKDGEKQKGSALRAFLLAESKCSKAGVPCLSRRTIERRMSLKREARNQTAVREPEAMQRVQTDWTAPKGRDKQETSPVGSRNA
jgi:hypothetical protein